MKFNLGLKKVMATIPLYPTLAEIKQFAVSGWRKKHKPDCRLDDITRGAGANGTIVRHFSR